jgi:hypothetical protein
MKQFILTIAVAMLFSFNLFGQGSSIYTPTSEKACIAAKQAVEDGYIAICPGVGGYKLELLEGDLRQTINVISPNKKKTELNLWSNISGGFSSVGEKVEWRMKGKSPTSFIVRFNASENPEDSSTITSYLVVVKLSKTSSCIVDVINPSKTQNIEARKSADASGGKACKTFE